MLLTRLAHESITAPLMVLALLQFPVYGAVIGLAGSKSRQLFVGVLLLVAHTVAAGLCFSGLIPNFS